MPPNNRLSFILGIIALFAIANSFTISYVGQEQYIYFWDWAAYWHWHRSFSHQLLNNPIAALHDLAASVRHDDYNLLPVVALAPFAWMFGSGRLAYILAVTNIYLVPSALLLGALMQRALHLKQQEFLLVASAALLLLHTLWLPVLRGFPDVVGLTVIAGIMILQFSKPIGEMRWSHALATGGLLCLLFLLRRWYLFWVVAFFPAMIAVRGFETYRNYGASWRPYIKAFSELAVAGLVFVTLLFICAAPLAIRVFVTDYSDIYSAYRFDESVRQTAWAVFSHFGWALAAITIGGMILLLVREQTRVLCSFVLVQSIIIFVLFARTQAFGPQHYYLLFPLVAIGVAAAVAGICMQVMHSRFATIALVSIFVFLLSNSASVFLPQAIGLKQVLGLLGSTALEYPFVRNDLREVTDLLNRLDELTKQRAGDIYVLASSTTINSSILKDHCELSVSRRAVCDHILGTHDVDKRDGFPKQFLSASYLVVGVPAQFHLRSEDQRVVGVLVRDVVGNRGVGTAYDRLPGSFKLDNGVTIAVFVKARSFSRSDLQALEDEFIGYYPGRERLFSITEK